MVLSNQAPPPVPPHPLLLVCQKYLSLLSSVWPHASWSSAYSSSVLWDSLTFHAAANFSSADSAECGFVAVCLVAKIAVVQNLQMRYKIGMIRKTFTFVMKCSVALRYLKLRCYLLHWIEIKDEKGKNYFISFHKQLHENHNNQFCWLLKRENVIVKYFHTKRSSNSALGTGPGTVTPLHYYEIRELKKTSNSIQVIRTISQKSVLSEKKWPQTS